MKDIVPLLRSLGLLDSEVKTYLTGFEHGAGTVLDYTKRTKLSRQATYAAIESLTKRGLMTSVVHGKKRLFTAEHPDKLLTYAKRRETEMKDKIADLERALPELELQMGGERPVVRVFEGKEGIRAFIEDAKRSHPKNINEIADLEAVNIIMDAAERASARREIEKMNSRTRGIYAGKPTDVPSRPNHLYLNTPEETKFKSNITVYDDRVALITLEGKMYTIIIESKPIARALHILFEKALKDLPQK